MGIVNFIAILLSHFLKKIELIYYSNLGQMDESCTRDALISLHTVDFHTKILFILFIKRIVHIYIYYNYLLGNNW